MLRANWRQFALLVLVNAFVGGVVGIERSVLPLLAGQDFHLASSTAVLSFIVSFGLAKAGANLLAGHWCDRYGRKPVLIAGWLFGLPVPLLLIFASTWEWVIAANLLLGINQGLAWSATVIMKIDLAGPSRRGLAMGLNEAAGYLAVSLAAFASGLIAATYGLRPYPFVLGLVLVLAGLFLSLFWVRETVHHGRHQADQEKRPAFSEVLVVTSWKDPALSSISQAGLVNNLNDGMAWGLFPLFFVMGGLALPEIAALAGLYPAVWGLAQLGTGPLSDRLGRKPLIVAGMWLQAAGIAGLLATRGFPPWAACMVLLGLGTALVYPTLLAAVFDVAPPAWRASAVGVYRLWRDAGYAAGALLAGVLADLFGAPWAIGAVSALTFFSGLLVLIRMYETRTAAPRW